MKKDCGFPQPSFIAAESPKVTSLNSFVATNVAPSQVSLFDIAVRIGRVEQMLDDARLALEGAR